MCSLVIGTPFAFVELLPLDFLSSCFLRRTRTPRRAPGGSECNRHISLDDGCHCVRSACACSAPVSVCKVRICRTLRTCVLMCTLRSLRERRSPSPDPPNCIRSFVIHTIFRMYCDLFDSSASNFDLSPRALPLPHSRASAIPFSAPAAGFATVYRLTEINCGILSRR